MIHQTLPGRIFSFVNGLLITLFCISVLFPFVSLLITSFSTAASASLGGFDLDFSKMSFANYSTMLRSQYIWSGYLNTIFRTVVGTVLSVLLTSLGAYCLSKPFFPHRTFWMGFVVFTMFFSGGLIPTYLVMCEIGMKNSIWSMILPCLISTYNLVIMRNFFQQIPAAIEESGRIDGAGNLRILFSLIYPISTPVLATIALWVAVSHWNAWFDCLVYIRDADKFVLQVVLRRIVLQGSTQMIEMGVTPDDVMSNPDGLKAAAIFVATLPILCIYPFAQKYFVKGIIVGSLKG
ncbi:MAG: carbohydrate ABC transporter permease [Firmicutes bacterium]|nr:carbohydrate ABC transporter permease [Bacillota bacterium]